MQGQKNQNYNYMGGKIKSRLNENAGRVLHWQKETNGVSGKCEKAQFLITVYKDGIVRIQVTRDNFFEDFSYSVINKPGHTTWQVTDSFGAITITTSRLTLTIGKNPLNFHFQTPQGQTINQDDEAFGTSWIGDQVTTYKKLQPGERFIGLGEKTGPLDRRGFGYTNWNTDNFGYTAGSDPLYCSTPFFIGVHHDLIYGIFLDNSHKTYFNFGASNDRFASFSADLGEMNYYFIHGNTVADILEHYTFLTGRM